MYFAASAIIAASNSSQVAAARAAIGDKAIIAPITKIRIRMKRPTGSVGICCGNLQKVRKWQARRSIAWFLLVAPVVAPSKKHR